MESCTETISAVRTYPLTGICVSQVIWTVIVTEFVVEPPVAETVTMYVPEVILCPPVTVNVVVPDPPEVNTIDEVPSEDRRRLDESVTERVIVPLKPLRLVRVIVLVPDEPRVRLSEDGFADIEKSPVDDTVSDRFVEWESEPLDPVTATL